MSEKIICAMLIIVGIIHVIPISGVLGPERLTALYGLKFDDPSLQILMRHRAILFGLLGVFILYAAFTPALQPMAFLAAAVSIFSFFWLAYSAPSFNPGIQKIVTGDIIAAIALGIAVLLYYLKPSA